MGMRQLQVENELRDVVSRIIVQVELATAQGRTDINLALEDAFIPILRSVYNLPRLINLNRKQKNYPGIDLGDDHDRVAFQITSTTSLDKVKFTIKQFMDRSYFNSFDELYILMLSPKQASYSQISVNSLLTEEFSFDCKRHIIDLRDLLGQVAGLRLAAQERVLTEFKHVLGEVDAYISYSTDGIAAPVAITSNLQRIKLPPAVWVAEVAIDDKDVIKRAKTELAYQGKAKGRRSVVRMALRLHGVDTDAWAYHDNRLFAFHDMEQSGLVNVVERGTIERMDASDLADSDEVDNVNVFKQMLAAETREHLKARHVRMHPKDGFFYFSPTEESQISRMETWIGKKTAIRRVYELKYQKKDPSKVAHHKHLSFALSFTALDDEWYAQIVPGWYYSYDGFLRSNWHDDLLSQQKRLEHNSSVRNQVRFVAYFLASIAVEDEGGLRFETLLEFGAGDCEDTEPVDDQEEAVIVEEGATA
ncbi:SMEK domain-containing protein [Rhizobium alvei]|uniref:SMEK domain-containing protein n=1 Tax=Rhizobium alvei TaxID=1132659 RepID=A0ABT8YS33_9HYPH|nr:SMEK domain-containing protein [Rhizobium alvei]MDO6966114.1 SMEK domain-containing protein [Rhizobium alvei]